MNLSEKIFELIKSCGVVACRMQEGIINEGKEVEHLKDETNAHYAMRQAKTKVDDMVQEMILKGLYPWCKDDVFLDVEEDTITVSAYKKKDASYGIIVDPIDGTLPYINQSDEYSICLGITHQHDFVLAVVYFPKKDELYYYGVNHGVRYYSQASQKCFEEYEKLNIESHKHCHIIIKNARVKEQVLQPFIDEGYTIIDDSEEGYNCPKAILALLYDEIDAYLCDHRNLRDVLLAVIYSHLAHACCFDFDGNKIVWEKQGRQPSIFISNDEKCINSLKKVKKI